jgi:hypothetical protein
MKSNFSSSEFEDILVYFAHSILDQNSEEDIAWDIAKNCISRLGFEDAVIYQHDEKHDRLKQIAEYGPKEGKAFQVQNPIFIRLGEGITGFIAQSGIAEIISDTRQDPRYIVDDKPRLSEICVPVVLQDKIYGVIDCESSHLNFFNDQHLRILKAIASIYAIKVKKLRSEKIIREKERRLIEIQRELLTLKTDALRTHMSPHFIFNSINAIQYFITVSEKESALHFLSTFSKLLRHHLSYFEKDEVPVAQEIKLIDWYFTLQKMRYENQFEYEVICKIEENLMEAKIPSMVIGVFIEHILESSIIDNIHPLKVKIKIKSKEDNFYLTSSFLSSIKGTDNAYRSFSYRDHLPGWEAHIQLLNRLHSAKIKRQVKTRILENGRLFNHVVLQIPFLNIKINQDTAS